MKRRAIITVTTCVLYVALLAVIWIIGSNQAAQKTEAQLDYAILDFRNTIDGAIDTMLGYIAKTAVSHFGTAERHTLEEMQLVANKLNIDEVNIVDRRGRIIASNDPSCLDVDMTVKKETSPFLALTNGATPTVSQHFRKHAYNTTRRKYLGVAFPGGNGFIQVGLDEQHLSKILPMILGYIFDQWLLGRTGFFLCADASTDKLISNPSRHLNEASTLSEAGFREKDAKPFETTLSNTDLGKTFKQRLFGETCYCRNYLFAGHRFVPALPEREYYDTRAIYTTVFAVLLFIVLSTFAWFINRVLHDSEQLKLFYDSREELRARDMSIAKTIQNSALPNRLPDDPRFLLAADMCAARDVGGDFYDHFQMDATHYAFLVADVSGKGKIGRAHV